MYCVHIIGREYSHILQLKFIAMLGRLEEGVLTAIAAAVNEPTAAQLHEMLSPIFDKTSLGGIHVTLESLERKGMVTRRLGEPTQNRGGKAQYIYGSTVAGERALAETTMLNAGLALLRRNQGVEAEDPIPPAHPGRMLDEHLRDLEWPVAYAAGRFDITRVHLYRILGGETGLTPAMAKALARNNIGGTALDWLICQAKYDLAQPEKPLKQSRRYGHEPKH